MLLRVFRASPSIRRFSSAVEPIRYVKLTSADANDVFEYVFDNFVLREPLTGAVKWQKHQASECVSDLVNSCIDSSFSYAARNTQDEIVGVRLARVSLRPKDLSVAHPLKDYGHQNVNDVMKFLSALFSQLWHKVPEDWDKVLESVILSVNKDYNKQGIGRMIMDYKLDEVKAAGCKAIVAEYTALKSQRLAYKNNYWILHEILHKDWVDEKGNRIFTCDDGTDRGFLACLPL
uniref:aralkylamine N-acetyltransferase n=1 Tax=Steinernema glaseri TaxID=37863 RepID=A0A1I8AL97_9BILA